MALREINLVPPEIVTHRFLFRHLNLWAGCLVVSLLLVAGFFVYQSRIALADTVPQKALRETTARLNAKIDEINRLKKEVEGIVKDQSVMDAIAGKQSYSRILLRVSTILNASTWLSQITVDTDPSQNNLLKMKLAGYSISNRVLGDFMNRLSFEPTFNDVALRFSREGQVSDPNGKGDASMKVVLFLIECNISEG